MLYKRLFILFFFIITYHYGFSQWKMYSIVDTIPIKKSANEKKLFNDFEKWFEKEKQVKLVRLNSDQFIIEGKGYFVYYNHIIIENIFLSPRAAERTTGSIAFSIRISIQDSIVVAESRNFVHEAYYSQYGKISFGSITDYETVPPGKCMENEIWCNAVWSDMKDRAQEVVLDKFSRLVASSNVRKEGKAYVVKGEEEVQDTVNDKKVDDYLNLDNYLIKE